MRLKKQDQINIALIIPNSKKLLEQRQDVPAGLLSIATILENAGFCVSIIDYSGRVCDKYPVADIYGISTYTVSYYECLRLLKNIRQSNPSAVVVAGGPHASALPNQVLADGFDAIVIGECEKNITQIIQNIISGQRGIFRGEAYQKLDDIPILNYNLVDLSSYNRKLLGQTVFSYMTSRGCPYRCWFCWTANNLNGKCRYHSIKRVIDDIQMNKYIRFVDDNIITHKKRFFQLCDELKELKITYRCSPRVTDLDRATCQALAESGCYLITLGVESGSDTMLNKMNKRQTTQDIKNGLMEAKRAGLIVRIGLVIGFPGETWDTIKEGVRFLKTIPFDEFNPYIFVPFPGTLPYHYPERFGIIRLSENWEEYHILSGYNVPHTVFETKELSVEKLKEMWSYTNEELQKYSILGIQDKDNR